MRFPRISPVLVLALLALGAGCATTPKQPKNVPPKILFQPAPVYPLDMRMRGISGDVVVHFVIDRHGKPVDCTVVSSPHESFHIPAIAAIQQSRFEPATVNGKPVQTRTAQVITFTLRDPLPSVLIPAPFPVPAIRAF